MKNLSINILAHKNIEQVVRLIDNLKNDDIDIYIHIDKRWNEGYERIKSLKNNNVYLTEERYESDLDSFNLVKASMSMIKLSNSLNKNYKYYALLSGQDYPINNLDKINKLLNENYPKAYIDCTPYDKNNWIYHKFNSYGFFRRMNRKINKRIKNKVFRKIIKIPVYLIGEIIDLFASPYKDMKKMGISLYGGSAWWILPDLIIKEILMNHESNCKLIDVFSKSHTPEETFFQTMAMKSKYKDLIELNNKDMILQNCLTYAHFFTDSKPFRGHPYILTKEDLYLLIKKSEKFMFARKFDINEDSQILDLLDELIKKNKSKGE